jgi:hypothetical protein
VTIKPIPIPSSLRTSEAPIRNPCLWPPHGKLGAEYARRTCAQTHPPLAEWIADRAALVRNDEVERVIANSTVRDYQIQPHLIVIADKRSADPQSMPLAVVNQIGC